MIGIPFELDLSSLPAPFQPRRIVRKDHYWPGYRDPGEANNIDQIGAWSLLAEKNASKDPSWMETAMHNAHEWILHYLRHDGGIKDEAHFFAPGLRHYLRVLKEQWSRFLKAHDDYEFFRLDASAVFVFHGPRSFAKLAEYSKINDNTGKPYIEPRVVGRALSNCAAYAYHQMETGGAIPDLSVLSKAIKVIGPGRFVLDRTKRSSTGWSMSGETPFLVLQGYTSYQPSAKDPYWHYIPWQYFSTLTYGILEAFQLLDDDARDDARDILRGLHRLAKLVTKDFAEWGGTNEATSEHDEGMVRRLASYTDSKLLTLEPEESSTAERTYSFRFYAEKARPMMEGSHVAFQPTCLPVKDRESLLAGVVR